MKWALVLLLALVALGLRTVPRYEDVFQPEFVNFQESDAWFHVRTMENLAQHYPWRMQVDPYLGDNGMVGVATGPFYDWVGAGLALLVGVQHLHVVAAWYPAVLGALLVPVVFLLGRRVFGETAAWVGAAVVATLPGHWLAVSSLGFTDHHVMESLLATGYLLALVWAMEKPEDWRRTLGAGVVLGAYALTFVGAAFFVAIVVVWGGLAALRGVGAGRPLWGSLLVAAVLAVGHWELLWMLYTLAALVGGAAGVVALEAWGRWCGEKRGQYWGGLAVAAAAGLFAVRGMLGGVLPFLMPAYFGRTGAVAELQALVLDPAGVTLAPAWKQFGGAFVLALVGLYLLGEEMWKLARRERLLVWVWGVALLVLALGQLRMTYYFAAAAAVVAGYVVGKVVEGETRAQVRWAVVGVLLLVVFVPNLVRAWDEGQKPRGVSAEWRGAMEWLRANTPAPFGDEGFYLARYETVPKRVDGYRVMAWWDYGYWVEAIARRVPVSNPTQTFAREAAQFYLAETELEALEVARRMKAKYVVANAEMPLRMTPGGEVMGQYLALYAWAGKKKPQDALLVVQEKDGTGAWRPRILYRPAYYRSMGVRLNGVGGDGVEGRLPMVAHVAVKQDANGREYKELRELRRYASEAEAVEAERRCQSEGCVLVGEDPLVSCVRLEKLDGLRLVYDKGAAAVSGSGVRIYRVVADWGDLTPR